VGFALHCYQDVHGCFPPAVVYGKDGQPLYSWRVLILPFVEEQKRYEQFKLDEPWDSPHNIRLLSPMPPIYASTRQSAETEADATFVQAIVGKGAAFEGSQGLKLKDFTDGSSNTLLLVETRPAVPWSKPEDVVYTPDGPPPELGGVFRDGFRALFADGHMHFLRKGTSSEVLRALITRNGGEQISAYQPH
jgi:hypothetical protein